MRKMKVLKWGVLACLFTLTFSLIGCGGVDRKFERLKQCYKMMSSEVNRNDGISLNEYDAILMTPTISIPLRETSFTTYYYEKDREWCIIARCNKSTNCITYRDTFSDAAKIRFHNKTGCTEFLSLLNELREELEH